MYRHFMKYIHKLVHHMSIFCIGILVVPHNPMGAEDQLSFPVICWWLVLTTDT